MDSYSSFASVYDLFMDTIPHEEWFAYYKELLNTYKVPSGILLDLGCGTGSLTRLLAKDGYDMIGIDLSSEMLDIAKSRSEEDILYINQDMREFELYGTVSAVISSCDSINYILEEEELLDVFSLVNNYLDPGGVFIFDLNTPYKYEEVLKEEVFAENREESSFIWENYYDMEDEINEYHLTLFIKEDELYRKFEEVHYQRSYSLDKIKELVEKAGLRFVAAYHEFSMESPKEESERIFIVTQECQKQV